MTPELIADAFNDRKIRGAIAAIARRYDCDPDDCTQDTMLRLMASTLTPDSLIALVRTTAKSVVFDKMKATRRSRLTFRQIAAGDDKAILDQHANRLMITDLLKGLKPRDRKIMIALAHGLTTEEIGQRLGMKHTTVRQVVFKVRKNLNA